MRPYQCVLNRLLGILAVAGHPPRQAVEAILEGRHERLEGVRSSLDNALEQLRIAGWGQGVGKWRHGAAGYCYGHSQ